MNGDHKALHFWQGGNVMYGFLIRVIEGTRGSSTQISNHGPSGPRRNGLVIQIRRSSRRRGWGWCGARRGIASTSPERPISRSGREIPVQPIAVDAGPARRLSCWRDIQVISRARLPTACIILTVYPYLYVGLCVVQKTNNKNNK